MFGSVVLLMDEVLTPFEGLTMLGSKDTGFVDEEAVVESGLNMLAIAAEGFDGAGRPAVELGFLM